VTQVTSDAPFFKLILCSRHTFRHPKGSFIYKNEESSGSPIMTESTKPTSAIRAATPGHTSRNWRPETA
jgi:hypothetical protein